MTFMHAVSEPFACDFKAATIEQHLLMTRSTECRKIKQKNGLNKLQQHKMAIDFIVYIVAI